jgi:hypothetical protein
VLAKSQGRRAKEIAIRRRKLAKLWRSLRTLRRTRQRPWKRDTLLHKLGAAHKAAGRAWRFVKITLPKARQPVNRDPFKFEWLKDKLQAAQERDGHYLRRMMVLLAAIACLGVPRPPGGFAQPAVSGASAGQSAERRDVELREGGIICGPTLARRLAVVFTGHGFAEGGEVILNELGKHKGNGSFFLTGDFLTNPRFKPLVQRIVREGHYLGPHSDKHVLYCPWDGPKKTLVTHAEFRADLESNLGKIERFGIPRRQIRYFLPPYEYYNQEIVDWAKELGLTLVNYTPARARMRITPARRRRTSSPHRPSSTASLPGRSRTQTV